MPIDPRTRGSLPPDPAVKGSDFGAAMNNVFVALVDLSRRIFELEGERTKINDQSITTGMVQTGAITTSTIAAGSITAAQIQVGNVVASIMTVGAVNAGHIDAASIRSSVLDATVLTATNAYITSLRASILDAGVLTAASAQIGSLRTSILNSTQIVAQGLQTQVLSAVNAAITTLASFNVTSGTITADLIRTAASGARVEIGATAGGIKGYNASNVMTFGFDTTTGAATVGAISVTGAGTAVPASTLTGFVGGGNLLKDSSFESTDPALPAALWTVNAATISKQTTQAFHSTKSLRILNTGTGQVYSRVNVEHGVPIGSLANRPVVFSAWVYVTGTDNSTPTDNKSLLVSDQFGWLSWAPIASIPKNTWTRVVLKQIVPAGATDFYVQLWNPYTSGLNTVYYDGIQFELGDAATAYSPKADEIIYGSITSVEIAASSINATRLNVSTLSAISADMGTITAGTITGATFQTSASNPKVAFDSTGFYVTDSGAVHQVDLNSSGLQFLAGASSTPPIARIVEWKKADGTLSGAIKSFSYQQNVGIERREVTVYSVASSSTDIPAVDIVAEQTDASQVYVTVENQSTSTAGKRIQLGAGAVVKTLIDGAGGSSFMQLIGVSTRKLNWGTATVTWPGATPNATALVVAHSLGATPAAVVVTPDSTGPWSVVQVGTLGAANFTLNVRDATGASPANGTTQPVRWVAIG